ncbi:MAG: KpsF/GutQ family sugar-phosphate isomerase, partial [Pseudomonadota bacterium]
MTDTLSLRHVASAEKTLEIEIGGLKALKDALKNSDLGPAFEEAVETIAKSKGRLAVTGIGKSG